MSSSKKELLGFKAWMNAKPSAEVYVKKPTGVMYPVVYLNNDRDGTNFVAEDAKVHLLPEATVYAFKIKPMTKAQIEHAINGGYGYVWCDSKDIDEEDVILVGNIIILNVTY